MLCPALYRSTYTSRHILGIVTSRWRLSYSGMVGRSSCMNCVPVCEIRIQIGVTDCASTTLDGCWNSFPIVPPAGLEPAHIALKERCSATELQRHNDGSYVGGSIPTTYLKLRRPRRVTYSCGYGYALRYQILLEFSLHQRNLGPLP